MSAVDINKALLAVFSALLVVLLLNNVIDEITHTEPLEHKAYAVAVSETSEQAAPEPPAEAALEPVTALLAAADVAAGEQVTKKCTACHTFNEGGANKVGPNLWGVVGRQKAGGADYAYSSAMAEKGGTWTYDDLNAFLASPKDFVNGTKMSFAGIKGLQDRANVIAYLRQQASNPEPLPGQ